MGASARKFTVGMDRNDQDKVVAHLYEETGSGDEYRLTPMCERGWNRSDGAGFSIFRGNASEAGICKVCVRRRREDRPAIAVAKGHKTKWI